MNSLFNPLVNLPLKQGQIMIFQGGVMDVVSMKHISPQNVSILEFESFLKNCYTATKICTLWKVSEVVQQSRTNNK